MKAGFGNGEIIFPSEMFPLQSEGFAGVHDNPHVRVMVLEAANGAMAIAAMELVNVPTREIEYTRLRIAEVFGIRRENVWVHMTHAITTPHEPGPMGPPDKRAPLTEEDVHKQHLFSDAIEHAVDASIRMAQKDWEEVRLGWGSGTCMANQNRDVETELGWWTGTNGAGYSDHEMIVLKVENLAGKTKGVFFNYAIKPCAIDNSGMKDKTRLVSAECCGVACVNVEEQISAPVLFVMGTAGDQIPVKTSLVDCVENGTMVTLDEGMEKGLKYAVEVGGMMRDSVLAITNQISCDIADCDLVGIEGSFEWEKRKGTSRKPSKKISNIPDGKDLFTYEVFRLGDVVFVAERPEVNAITGKQIKEASPFRHTVIMTMVNGEAKYLPDRESVERGTFEAQSAKFMPHAAERFVEETIKAMNKLKQ
jgi:hypothetical protein